MIIFSVIDAQEYFGAVMEIAEANFSEQIDIIDRFNPVADIAEGKG